MNLFHPLPDDLHEETFTELLRHGPVRIGVPPASLQFYTVGSGFLG